MTESQYSILPKEGPYDTAIGSALITMVEPHVGHEHAYNRWYEDDHFYSGAMAMPWMFGGRRWVATRELQLMRYPEESAIAQPVTAGCYISLYWITAGRYEDHLRWTVATNQRLGPDGRVYMDRTHIFTAFQEYVGPVYRDKDGPRDYQSLDYPYGGLVVEVVDALPDVERDRALGLVARRAHPRGARGIGRRDVRGLPAHPVARRQAGVRRRPPGHRPAAHVALVHRRRPPHGVGRLVRRARATRSPRRAWARSSSCAPFIPTIPGTEKYVDELR